jgi:hypothetical protein
MNGNLNCAGKWMLWPCSIVQLDASRFCAAETMCAVGLSCVFQGNDLPANKVEARCSALTPAAAARQFRGEAHLVAEEPS